MAATPSGGGYWIVDSDGGVFAFGGAGFYSSMGGVRLNAPVVGVAATSDGHGYWLAASDGGVFAFGDAPFGGSMARVHLHGAIVDVAGTGPGAGTGSQGPTAAYLLWVAPPSTGPWPA